MHTKRLTRNALLLGLLIMCSQLSIPLPGVPLNLQTLAVGLIASLLPLADGLVVIAVYIAIGCLGLPVFANYTSGIAVLFGPLGGYLLGFLAYVLAARLVLHFKQNRWGLYGANIAGSLIQLLVGSIWMIFFNHLTLAQALLAGTVPFLLPGAIKIVLVVEFSLRLEKIRALN